MLIGNRSLARMAVVAFIVFSCGGPGRGEQKEPDVEFVPTPYEVVAEMLKTAQVTQGDVVYDLGCGDGRIVIAAAKEFGARGVGVDIDPNLIKVCQKNALKEGVADRVKFILGDLFELDLREATVVALYLTQELNVKLRPKLFRELRPGSRIVSHDFDMGDWKPDQTRDMMGVQFFFPDDMPRVRDTKFHYWVIPADVAGIWRWSLKTSSGERHYTLDLNQKFQEISGKVNLSTPRPEGRGSLEVHPEPRPSTPPSKAGLRAAEGVKVRGQELTFADPLVTGDRITFRIEDEVAGRKVGVRFKGRVIGDTIKGNAEVEGGSLQGNHGWTAKRGL